MRIIGLFAAAILLTACGTTQHMQSYLGKDIQEVITDSGPPLREFNVSGNKRAFRYNWHYEAIYPALDAYKLQPPGKYNNSAAPAGFTVSYGYLTPRSNVYAGNLSLSQDCDITYVSEWSEEQESWIVVGYKSKDTLICL